MSDIDELRNQLNDLRESVDKLMSLGMKEKTILVLMNHYTGIPQKTIKHVLYAVGEIEEQYFGGGE